MGLIAVDHDRSSAGEWRRDGNTLMSDSTTGGMDATVTVADVEDVGPDTYAIRFETPAGFTAEPGQFVKLGTEIDGESVARFYTLSSPTVEETFEVTVGIDPEDGGPFSAFLASIEPGVEMSLSGPFGDHHYDGERRVVILAGGPGIGPAVAIAERAVTEGGEAAIVYRDDDPAHAARLKRLRDSGARIYLLDGDAELDAATADVVTDAGDEGVFVYGFADFVADAEAAIEATIGDADEAKVENFG